MANTKATKSRTKTVAKKEEKRSVGRPTLYKPEYAEQAYKLCLLGATDKEMADFFQVTESTLNLWKQEHAEFSESMGNGKIIADSNVAESLYKRATGYTAKKVVTASIGGVITDVKEVDEYIGPDTPAASLWLRNRQSAKWRDKLDLEHAGRDGGPIKTEHTQMPLDPVEAAKAYQRMIQGG